MKWIISSIRNKILAVFALGFGMLIAAAMFGFGSARDGLTDLERINKTLVAQTGEVQALETHFKVQVQDWKDVLLRGHDAQLFDKYWSAFQKDEQRVQESAKRLEQSVTVHKAKQLLGDFVAAHGEMGVKYRGGLEAYRRAGSDPKAGDLAVRGIDRAPTEMLEEAAKLIREESARTQNETQTGALRRLDASLLVIVIAAVAAIVLCGWLLIRIVVRPLADAARAAETTSSGDLTLRIEAASGDEAGRLLTSLEKMRAGLAGAVGAIRQSAENVGTASKQIATGNADMSSRVEEQASSLEETAASMEELTSTVKQNTDSAKQANQVAIGASEIAGRGGKVMNEVVATMGGIAEASKKIADIIGVIDGIAFQTNILALNAAVEAARAGEQGRGFAVVAAEVRTLAQRSAEAAKEIKGLIGASVERVDGGTALVQTAGRTMDEIVAAVKHVTQIMAEISAASQEQLAGIEQVNEAVTQMDQVTQQNASLVEESAAAAESMAEQAGQLLAEVARFKIDDAAAEVAKTVREHAPDLPAAERATQRLAPRRASLSAKVRAALPRARAAAAGLSLAMAVPQGAADSEWKQL